jgi:tRNA(His) 5'-end guanylyltransferase
VIGYTQSDEITLVLYSDSHNSQIWFDGKKFKIVSSAASLCSVVFAELIALEHPELGGKYPTFDCRAFNVPNKTEAANAVLWREQDASKNAISSAARCYYSHKELQDKTGPQKQEMLFAKGINFDKYPPYFKRGTWIQRKKSSRKFSPEEVEKLPPKHEARTNPDLVVERTDVVYLDMPPFSKVTNREGVIFDGEVPITADA